MKPFRRLSLPFLLEIAAVLGSLWMLALLCQPQTAWNPSYIFSYGWLDYAGDDDDGSPESACDCVAILGGDAEEIEKAKLLSLSRDFHKSVQIPDEYYINATQDCRCVAGFGRLSALGPSELYRICMDLSFSHKSPKSP